MVLLYYAFSANLAMLSTGLSVGWESSSVPKLLNGQETIRMTSVQSSWMDPLMLLGVVLGGTTSALVLNRIGRKKTLLLTAPTHILSWLLIAVADSPTEIMCSRVLSGVGSGLSFCATITYLSEVASVRWRGAVCGMQLFFYELGFLLSNIGGLFLGVKILAVVSAIMPIAFTILFVGAPETPYYLTLRGNCDAAQKALTKFRGKKNVEDEMKMIACTIEQDATYGKSFSNLFNMRSNARALAIVLCVTFSRNLAGSDNIHDHATIVFGDVSPEFDEKYLPIIFGVLKVCNSLIIVLLVDNSRKLMMLLSAIAAGMTTFIIGCYCLFRQTSVNVVAFRVVAVMVEVIFTLIFTSYRLSFILAGDLFATSMKAYGTATLTIVAHFGYYGIVHLYQVFASNTPIYASFFAASVFDFASIFLLYCVLLPETGQKTILEIQQLLKQKDDSEKTFSDMPTLRVR